VGRQRTCVEQPGADGVVGEARLVQYARTVDVRPDDLALGVHRHLHHHREPLVAFAK
jgi:hypothetical protein